MSKVYIYTIVFYKESDEYPHDIFYGCETEVFFSKESAEKYKADYEEKRNIEYIQERNGWYGTYRSTIDEKDILSY